MRARRHSQRRRAQPPGQPLDRPHGVDQDLYQDRVFFSVIRHPVVGSDGGVYEASSYLQILRHAGMSLINPAHRLTSAVRVPAIENTIDSLLGRHPERTNEYNIEAVMREIEARLNGEVIDENSDSESEEEDFQVDGVVDLFWFNVNNVRRDFNNVRRVVLWWQEERRRIAEERADVEVNEPEGLALALYLLLNNTTSVSQKIFVISALGMLVLGPVSPIISLWLCPLLFANCVAGKDHLLVPLFAYGLLYSPAVVGLSQFGLFAGEKMGYFPERRQEEEPPYIRALD